MFADSWFFFFFADSGRVLLKAFNGGFERREQKARKMLMEVVDAQKAAPGRKR